MNNALSTSKAREPAGLDLAALRARLNGVRGQDYWRSLDEVAETPEFQEMLGREFPDGASEWPLQYNRRDFLKLAAASLALAGVTACTKQPTQQILPYVNQPANLVLGEPLVYATSQLLGGFATGVLVKSREGHPIKVEGNPDHPASLGGSSLWMQAALLDLYDPDRSQAVTHHGEISTWALFLSDLNQIVAENRASQGSGLCFLTETVTSPTLAAQLRDLLKRFPKAKWHQFDPLARDHVRAGAGLAFGQPVETHYRFDRAAVVLSLDADFLYTHPERLQHTRQFTNARRLSQNAQSMNRLYVVETTPTVTGSTADHRLPLASADIENLARVLAEGLGAPVKGARALSPSQAHWIDALVSDLQANRGASVVVAGEWQPPLVHAVAHYLNEQLGNVGKTVFYTDSAEAEPTSQLQSLRELVDAMQAGGVDTLFVLGGNPVYSAPADLEFANHLAQVKRTVHLGPELDETAAASTWHIPQAHDLESWGDARSFDGTASLLQPLIAPLYNGKTAHELLGALVQQQPVRTDYDIVREFWRAQNSWADFEHGWRKALHDGFIAGTALPAKDVRVRADLFATAELAAPGAAAVAAGPELTIRPDPNLWDGRFANNGWLQECPKPISKLSWDNALLISPAFAQQHGLKTEDVVRVRVGERSVNAPVWILPGQAENAITLHVGYGRQRVGRVGAGVGCNGYALRTTQEFWRGSASLSKTGRQHRLVTTQLHHNVHSPERQVYRAGTWQEFRTKPDFVQETVENPPKDETLYYPGQYLQAGYQWAMSIDLTTCIGCNACLVACEAENNIPVVGKDQIGRGREMFWIRVDTYYKGGLDNPEFHHMPVPCMHCEHAPCELVCPVAATVHDHEGLNVQVYNRCVGTRFCSNNCPYKVRRFNFLGYTDYSLPSLKPMYNPEVTVRWRGVMEKCTYCIQRISRARIRAEKENRRIGEGEIQTACQQACPAEAIVFGDLNNPNSRVGRLKKHSLDYSMLGELNTRPRTTYLAKVQNPNPAL
jgi:MoCo/4Fe-4S cofactor protein with predicted Tat translocation signal